MQQKIFTKTLNLGQTNVYELQIDPEFPIKVITMHNPKQKFSLTIYDRFDIEATEHSLSINDIYATLSPEQLEIWEMRSLKRTSVPAGAIKLMTDEPLEIGKRYIYAN